MPPFIESDPRWISLGNRFYEKYTIYSALSWNLTSLDISNSLVACSPCAGPVAVVPDSGWGVSSALLIFAANGSQVARFETLRVSLEFPVRVVSLLWIGLHTLHVVYQDGCIIRLSLFAAVSRDDDDADAAGKHEIFLFSTKEQSEEVFDVCHVEDRALLARTISGGLYVLSLDKNSPRRVAQSVLPPQRDISEQLCASNGIMAKEWDGIHGADGIEVLAIGKEHTLYRVSNSACVEANESYRYRSLSASSDGQFFAGLLMDGDVVVQNFVTLSTIAHFTLERISSVIENVEKPRMLGWVGSDAVLIVSGGKILLAGPGGDLVLLYEPGRSEEGIIFCSERDGIRLCFSGSTEFVRLVPETVQAVHFQPGSPGYRLLRGSRPGCSHSEKSDHGMSWDSGPGGMSIRETNATEAYSRISDLRKHNLMPKATQDCINAAYFEWDVCKQKCLLNAAAYGRQYDAVLTGATEQGGRASDERAAIGKLPLSHRSSMSDVSVAIAVLRVLNGVRNVTVGIPLTMTQLNHLGFRNLVRRLSDYSLHLLALRIAAFCALSPNDALIGWVARALREQDSDEEIAEKVIRFFDFVRNVFNNGGTKSVELPFITAAEQANAMGRRRCAELLLHREHCSAAKVPLYLSMNQNSMALAAAMASNDSDVVLSAVEELRKQLSLRELSQLFKTLPFSISHRATDLVADNLRQQGNTEDVCTLLVETGRYREAAMELIACADSTTDGAARISALESAYSNIVRWSHRRVNVFELHALHSAILAAYGARDLERKCGIAPSTLMHSTSSDLLRFATQINDESRRKEALQRLRKDLKVPERRYFWVVLEGLVDIDDMRAVEELSFSAGRGRPPPIGLTAFVDTCVLHGREEEAVQYAMRIPDLRDRARALAACGRGKEAADIASKLRNQQLLQEVEALVARHVTQVSLQQNRE